MLFDLRREQCDKAQRAGGDKAGLASGLYQWGRSNRSPCGQQKVLACGPISVLLLASCGEWVPFMKSSQKFVTESNVSNHHNDEGDYSDQNPQDASISYPDMPRGLPQTETYHESPGCRY